MSKRQISKQQRVRIHQKEAHYRDQTSNQSMMDALVIARYSSRAIIESAQGKLVSCAIRRSIDSLVAGDRVVWQSEGNDQGLIISRYPRTTVLGRPDKRNKIKAIAANISQMVIVIAPKPNVSWPLLDSYLIIAECFNLNACILLNKTDLPCDKIKKRLQNEYEPLEYPVLFRNHINNSGFTALQEQLNHQISVFVGQSGVGKSFLINTLLPSNVDIKSQAISTGAESGKHTTSYSFYYHLAEGGGLIDSPGVREFGLWHMADRKLAEGYKEFKPYLVQCKFRNCNHQDTPGCAIYQAVKEGKIATGRYKNYLKICEQFFSKIN